MEDGYEVWVDDEECIGYIYVYPNTSIRDATYIAEEFAIETWGDFDFVSVVKLMNHDLDEYGE